MDFHHLYRSILRNLPVQCVVCKELIGVQTPRNICISCFEQLPRPSSLVCRVCAIALPKNANLDSLCGRCLETIPAFSGICAPFSYEFPMDIFVNRFKHQHDFLLLPMFLHELEIKSRQWLTEKNIDLDCIVPIPLHWRRQVNRGYNQAQLLGKPLSKMWSVAYNPNLLQRRFYTAAQQGYNRKQRQRNLKDCFLCTEGVDGQRIALIDDVVTTATTVAIAAKELLKAGAEKVVVFSLCRTPEKSYSLLNK